MDSDYPLAVFLEGITFQQNRILAHVMSNRMTRAEALSIGQLRCEDALSTRMPCGKVKV
jgi:hypothetical protein